MPFQPHNDSNQIWYCCSEVKIFPENFISSYHIKEVIEDIKRLYPKKKIKTLSREYLEYISLDFQYRIIPSLYNLTKAVNSDLPLTIKYFSTTFILLIVFGLILPTLTSIFISEKYALLSIFIVIGIVSHILLSLNTILTSENTLNKKNDYF